MWAFLWRCAFAGEQFVQNSLVGWGSGCLDPRWRRSEGVLGRVDDMSASHLGGPAAAPAMAFAGSARIGVWRYSGYTRRQGVSFSTRLPRTQGWGRNPDEGDATPAQTSAVFSVKRVVASPAIQVNGSARTVEGAAGRATRIRYFNTNAARQSKRRQVRAARRLKRAS